MADQEFVTSNIQMTLLKPDADTTADPQAIRDFLKSGIDELSDAAIMEIADKMKPERYYIRVNSPWLWRDEPLLRPTLHTEKHQPLSWFEDAPELLQEEYLFRSDQVADAIYSWVVQDDNSDVFIEESWAKGTPIMGGIEAREADEFYAHFDVRPWLAALDEATLQRLVDEEFDFGNQSLLKRCVRDLREAGDPQCEKFAVVSNQYQKETGVLPNFTVHMEPEECLEWVRENRPDVTIAETPALG